MSTHMQVRTCFSLDKYWVTSLDVPPASLRKLLCELQCTGSPCDVWAAAVLGLCTPHLQTQLGPLRSFHLGHSDKVLYFPQQYQVIWRILQHLVLACHSKPWVLTIVLSSISSILLQVPAFKFGTYYLWICKTCDYRALKSFLKLYSPHLTWERVHTGILSYSQNLYTVSFLQYPVYQYQMNQSNTSWIFFKDRGGKKK